MINTSAQSSDNAAVAQAVDAFYQAVIAKNRQQLELLTSEHLSYGHSVGRIEDKAQCIANTLGPRTVWKSIDRLEPTIQMTGDIALARHVMVGVAEREGKSESAKMGVLMVWQKHSGAWKLLARQSFKL
jgi:fibrillarin-like rRNA methylase